MNTAKKKILFILRSSPYGSAMAQEGIDSIMAASVFDQDITVLFMDEGVLQLHNHQQSLGVEKRHELVSERKNIAAQIESFPLYDIDKVYVDIYALSDFHLDEKDLILEPSCIGDFDIQEMIKQHDVVLSY